MNFTFCAVVANKGGVGKTFLTKLRLASRSASKAFIIDGDPVNAGFSDIYKDAVGFQLNDQNSFLDLAGVVGEYIVEGEGGDGNKETPFVVVNTPGNIDVYQFYLNFANLKSILRESELELFISFDYVVDLSSMTGVEKALDFLNEVRGSGDLDSKINLVCNLGFLPFKLAREWRKSFLFEDLESRLNSNEYWFDSIVILPNLLKSELFLESKFPYYPGEEHLGILDGFKLNQRMVFKKFSDSFRDYQDLVPRRKEKKA